MIRLNKFLADAGLGTRREADELIKSEQITINGEVCTELSRKVSPKDVVTYKGKILKKERFKYFIINQGKGQKASSIIANFENEQLQEMIPLKPGETGLSVWTDDLEFISKINQGQYIKCGYRVELDDYVTEDLLLALSKKEISKVYFDNFEAHSALSFTTQPELLMEPISVIIDQEIEIMKVDRAVFHNIKKGQLTRGKYRLLEEKEIGFLKMAQ